MLKVVKHKSEVLCTGPLDIYLTEQKGHMSGTGICLEFIVMESL